MRRGTKHTVVRHESSAPQTLEPHSEALRYYLSSKLLEHLIRFVPRGH